MALTIRCRRHKTYRGIRMPRNSCGTCMLLYIFIHQNDLEPAKHLGPKPYACLITDLQEANEGLEVDLMWKPPPDPLMFGNK